MTGRDIYSLPEGKGGSLARGRNRVSAHFNIALRRACHNVAVHIVDLHARHGRCVNWEGLDESILPNVEDAHFTFPASTEHPLLELGVGEHRRTASFMTHVFWEGERDRWRRGKRREKYYCNIFWV